MFLHSLYFVCLQSDVFRFYANLDEESEKEEMKKSPFNKKRNYLLLFLLWRVSSHKF